MAEDDTIQSFPDITPSKITRTVAHEFEEFDIKTEEDFKALIHSMFEYPEREFYYFQEKGGPKNQFMLSKEKAGNISFAETEFFYYRRPNSSRDYIHLERHADDNEPEWAKEIIQKGPMFMKTTLRLPERTRRELEIMQRLELEEEFRRRRKEAEYTTDVFISYASADSNEADQIYEAVLARGKRAFLANKSLKPGEDFADEIRQALSSSRELWLLVILQV